MEMKDALRAARTLVDKTQEKVAAEAGMNVTQYNGYETGRSRPALATLERLAGPLGTSVKALMDELEPKRAAGVEVDQPTQTVDSLRDDFRVQMAALLNVAADKLIIRVELV